MNYVRIIGFETAFIGILWAPIDALLHAAYTSVQSHKNYSD